MVALAVAAGLSGFPPSGSAAAATNRDALALAIAKVAANEGALWNPRDTDLVCQVVRAAASTPEGRLAWLRSHSGRVLDRKPCLSGNCRWTRNLDRGGSMPAGLAAGRAWWRAEMRPRWQEVLSRAEACVRGPLTDKPCHLPPQTWGGPMDVQQAVARGLFPIGCEGTLNDGFRSVGGFRW